MNRLEVAFAGLAARTPEATAVQSAEGRLSYGELDRLANRIAHALLAAGVQRGDRVGIHLPRSARGIAAMIASLRVGAAFVPLDPASPPARVAIIARDCGLRVVVIAPRLLSAWVSEGITQPATTFVLTSAEALAHRPADAEVVSWDALQEFADTPPPEQEPDVDRPAYILYTSGSTGVPKGVTLSHRNARAFVDWAAQAIELAPADRVASVAPFHFDLSVFDVWSTLSAGATIVIIDELTVRDGRRMIDSIHAQQITVWYSVPSAWALMLDSGGLEQRGAPSLRAVYFAGEVFPMAQLSRTMRALPGAQFWNLFGPTETNVCLAHRVTAADVAGAEAIPIGRPVCGDTISIVDEAGRPVPEGAVGELRVDGPTVMLGYWSGSAPTPTALPYATGDLVARNARGDLMYHGRRDHMVKVHGHRIELGEVEAALVAHPSIREAIVCAHEQRLIAVVASRDTALSVLAVKHHCASRLPRYMIPSDVRLVRALPRTSSGKIDRVRTRRAAIEQDVSELVPLFSDA